MRTVEIPGGTAKFKDAEELVGRDEKRVKAAALAAQGIYNKLGDEGQVKEGETLEQAGKRVTELFNKMQITFTEQEAMSFLTLQETVAVVYLAEWTLDLPLPKTIDDLGGLPGPLYNALLDAVSGELGGVGGGGVDLSPNPDQSSPFGNSNGSSSSSKEELSPAHGSAQS